MLSAAPTVNFPNSPPVRVNRVVLLHGLGLGAWAMRPVAAALRKEGYAVVNVTYPSRWTPLAVLGGTWLEEHLRRRGVSPTEPLHVVTHSMGGILLRVFAQERAAGRLRRVVMLAPPNAGSEVVDRLQRWVPFHWFTGHNGRRLGTDRRSIPRALGPWPAGAGHLGIIAGNRSLNPLFSSWIGGPNDGKVSVSSTRLAGMSDFIVLPYSHTWLQWKRATIRQVSAFLREGSFVREQAADAPAAPRSLR